MPVTQPTPGDALQLTINAKLQRAAQKAIAYGIGLAHQTTDGKFADGGSIVAMDPSTGAILAMASSPTYQPSIFSGRSNAKKLQQVLDSPGRAAVQPRDRRRAIRRARRSSRSPRSPR